jgi:hypothetical protein
MNLQASFSKSFSEFRFFVLKDFVNGLFAYFFKGRVWLDRLKARGSALCTQGSPHTHTHTHSHTVISQLAKAPLKPIQASALHETPDIGLYAREQSTEQPANS